MLKLVFCDLSDISKKLIHIFAQIFRELNSDLEIVDKCNFFKKSAHSEQRKCRRNDIPSCVSLNVERERWFHTVLCVQQQLRKATF